MSKAAVSILVYGIYYLVAGICYFMMPDFALNLFGFPLEGHWILRTAGVLLGVHGFFFIQAARHELVPYFRWTVPGRIAASLAFAIMAALDLAQPMIILFGLVDLAGAIWTWLVLRAQSLERGDGTKAG